MLTSFIESSSTSCDSLHNESPTTIVTVSDSSGIYPTYVRLFLIFATVCLFVKVLLSSPRSSSFLSSLPLPPGPRGVPFLGFLPFLDKDFHVTLTSLSKKFGPVYQIFLGNNRVVVLNDAKLVREAFRQPVFSGRPDTELTKILQGYGMLSRKYLSFQTNTIDSQASSTLKELFGKNNELFFTQSFDIWEPRVCSLARMVWKTKSKIKLMTS